MRSNALPSILAAVTLMVLASELHAATSRPAASEPSASADHAQLVGWIEQCQRQRIATQKSIEKLQADLQALRETLATPGIASYIGPLLNERRRQLPDFTAMRKEIRRVRDEATSVQIRYRMLQDELDDRGDLGTAGPQDAHAKAAVLRRLTDDYRVYWKTLLAISALQEQLLAEAEAFKRVIDEHALWLPSAQPLYKARFPTSITPAPDTWQTLGDSLRRDAATQPGLYTLVGLACVLWLAGYGAVRSREAKIRELASHRYTDSFRLTVHALACAVYRAAALPALLWWCGERMAVCVPTANDAIYAFGLGLSVGLQRAALFLFVARFLKHLFRKGGVSEVHFHWNVDMARNLRKSLSWVTWLGTLAIFMVNFVEQHPDPAWRESVGRCAGLVALLGITVLVTRLLPASVLSGNTAADQARRYRPGRTLWRIGAIAVPLVLAGALVTGYPHTAMELARHVYRTLLLVVGLLVVRATIIRFVQVSREKLSIAQSRLEHAADAAAVGEPSTGGHGDAAADLLPFGETVETHARDLLLWLFILSAGVGTWFIWLDIIPAFSFLTRITLWTYSSQDGVPATTVYLPDLAVAIIAASLTAVLARSGPPVVDTALLARLPIDCAGRFAMVTVLRYVIFVVGAAITLRAIGLGWSRIHWLAAAITVGLGFGLQEIFANFVSGLIILFERPVRIGDIVTVGGVDGRITRIQIRATTVTDWNRRELIVPNKEFITGQIINWTLSDPVTRVDIPVGIAYGANTRQARDLLLRIARTCKHVLDNPAPEALFKGFGDSSLDFQLRVHIPTRDVWAEMIHEMHTQIDDEFRKAGIEIAFPQRDIHIRSMPEALRVEQSEPKGESETAPVSKSVREAMPGRD